MKPLTLTGRVYAAASTSLLIYSASAIALPMCLFQISRELGLTLTQAGSLGFFSSIEQFFVLILSCFVAARFGKIRVLRVALLILSFGLVMFTLSKSYMAAVLLILFIGLGNGFLEALLTPIVEDLYPQDNGSKMNLLHAFWPIGTCLTVLVFGELLSRGTPWQTLFIALSIIVLLISLMYPSHKKIELPQSRTDFSHMKDILSLPKFWMLAFALFFAGGAEGAFAFWSASYIQIQFNAFPRAAALGTACFALGMAAGRLSSSYLAGKLGLRKLMLISTCLGLVASLSFFLITNLIVLYVFLCAIGLSIACLWPSIQSYAGSVLKVDPTILMIFLSCFGIPGFSSSSLIMGIIGDQAGLHTSFIIAPIYLFFVILLLGVEKKYSDYKKD